MRGPDGVKGSRRVANMGTTALTAFALGSTGRENGSSLEALAWHVWGCQIKCVCTLCITKHGIGVMPEKAEEWV
jgi:hypothetical protein